LLHGQNFIGFRRRECALCGDGRGFSTYNPGDIAFIKSVLDGEDIHYFFQGESSAMLVAAGAYARLLVQQDQVERAREILQEAGFLK